ncbi:MAG: hypothetical protein E1N59_1202 [Puniceicoccaceae bacterium 5H]|nr:MAG: hypothetical protein E1N59_1202 [Puniceicoccaceae bacterium 5H]
MQSVYVDAEGSLWVLDPASPRMQGVQEGGAKLVKLDPETGEVIWKHVFNAEVVLPKSYLNDVRIDTRRGFAYITDSGVGGIVVVDLNTGEAYRTLSDHLSTQHEMTALVLNGQPYLRNGQIPKINSDGIALTGDGETLYYQALNGRTLYSVPTQVLRNRKISAQQRQKQVRVVGRTGGADGILLDSEGNLYLTALETNAIHRLTPDHQLEAVVQDDASIQWPDTLAQGPDGSIYFTTSRIHQTPRPPAPYGIYRIVRQR